MSAAKRIAAGLFILISLILAALFFLNSEDVMSNEPRGARAVIGDTELSVTVANSPIDQQRGLAGRTMLAENEGMIFLFSEPRLATFWMKGMLMPIDIIWIKNGLVIGVEKNAPPPPAVAYDFDLALYNSPERVDAVLEVAAGFAERRGIGQGAAFRVYR